MNYIEDFFSNLFLLLDAMSIYIMVGLLIAGVLKQLIPEDFISKNLGKDSTGSVIKATLFGIPLPVCSCSVIPIAQGLKKEGASKGAVQSFLISTPITGVDSILATFSFFGLLFTIFRIISSVIIAICVGIIQNFAEKKEKPQKAQFFSTSSHEEDNCCSSSCGCSSEHEEKEDSCCSSSCGCSSEHEEKEDSCCSSSCGCSSEHEEKEDSCCSSSCGCSSEHKKSFSLKAVFKYAYVTLFEDMVKSLSIGLILGALFTTFVPKEYSSILFENEILTYFAILIIAIPLYTCATASLPLAAAFMLQGMSAGAAFIFLTAGPATSAVTMSVIYKMLGKQSLIIYVSTIAILSLVFGFLFDSLFGSLEILNISEGIEKSGLIDRISSILMLLLIAYYLIKPFFNKKESCCCSGESCCS